MEPTAIGLNEDEWGELGTIFEDEYPLSPKYVPSHLVARNEQIEKVRNSLKPILRKGEPMNSIIHGKTGTGKTVVVKYILNQLSKKLESIEDINVTPVFVNCKDSNTTTQILYTIIKSLDPTYPIAKRGIGTGWYYKVIWELLNKSNTSLILVMDEIDRLKQDDLFYAFSRAGGGNNLNERLYVCIIGLTNNTTYFNDIDPRIRSSMTLNNITFPPYDAEQLAQILNDRVKLAFTEGAISEMVIPLCAAFAAQEHGDARKALALLHRSALIANDAHEAQVGEEHVRSARLHLDVDPQLEVIRTLPTHSKIVLYSAIKTVERIGAKTTSGDVTTTYGYVCRLLEHDPLSRTRIADLITELDMLNIIEAITVNKGRQGRTRLIHVQKDRGSKFMTELLSDFRLESLSTLKVEPFFQKHNMHL